MCGISGYIGAAFTDQQLQRSSACLHHRGPDANGFFYDAHVGLAHRRLSIIELSDKGAQPYEFENYVLVFNGELYNYQSVRALLIKQGYDFISNSDTEVLIKAFHCWGVSSIKYFTGMFAFAIYDKQSKKMFLFRDRIGVKPLYYTVNNGVAFASELRSVKCFVENVSLDQNSIWEYFRIGYITGKKSIYNEINKLEAGHFLEFHKGNTSLHSYWQMQYSETETDTGVDWKSELHTLMQDAFSQRMVADVPVGVFLSGGIDSSLVAAILQNKHGSINTFTIGFNHSKFDESKYAKKVADHLGTVHNEFIIDANEALPILQNFYDVYDEPFADSSGIPTILISRLAKENGVKVVLSADGGDELFSGYTHYSRVLSLFRSFSKKPASLRKATSILLEKIYDANFFKSYFSYNLEHRVAAIAELSREKNFIDFYNAVIGNQASRELSRLLNSDKPLLSYRNFEKDEQLTQLMLWDLNYFLTDDLLVKMDRATMYNSIEGREPFLDHRLIEMAFKMPNNLKVHQGTNKWIVKEILAEYLPRVLFDRPKKGFSIPIFDWFSSELDDLFKYYFTASRLGMVDVLNSKEVIHEYEKYKFYKQRKQEYNIEKMWRILSFMMWWDRCYKPLS
jgi:asparagine synthase (glutamine-hydrolysing)